MTSSSNLSYRTLLHDELKAVEQLMLTTLTDVPADVQQAVAGLIQNGGKRLRPALVLLSAHICEADLQQTLPVAAAVELLHTATLIHDDLIDNATLRRGAKTLNASWPPAATVLAGDTAFAWAAKLASQGQSLPLVTRFSGTLVTICSGELNQMFARDHIPTHDEYYARIFAKTASLFAMATEVGALLAKCSPAKVQAARNFGKLLGEAFQIADDVLDLMGDVATVGKPVGEDVRQGIITLPVLCYLETHPNDERVHAAATSQADADTLDTLIADIRASTAAEQAMAQAQAHIQQALTLLTTYPHSPYREAMADIARFAVQRKY